MANEPIFDKTLSHIPQKVMGQCNLGQVPLGNQALAHPPMPETLPQPVCASKITQDDNKLQTHFKAGISNFPSFPRSPSRLSEELPHLPHPLCILTNRLYGKLGWCFLGQLSLVERPRAPWPHRSCQRHGNLQDLEVLLLPKIHIHSIASGRAHVWAGALMKCQAVCSTLGKCQVQQILCPSRAFPDALSFWECSWDTSECQEFGSVLQK